MNPTGRIGSALKTRQARSIKYKSTNTVPKRHWEGHKRLINSTEKFYSEEAQTSAYEQPKQDE